MHNRFAGERSMLKRILKSKSGVSNVISTLLIISIMITSIALTYVYIIPTIERARMNATVSTSSLFMFKMDGAIQSLYFDGVGSARTIEVDAFTGNLEFRSYALNVRAYIDGSMFVAIPSLEYGLARLSFKSDVGMLPLNSIKYLKGSPYNSPVVTQDGQGTIDPAIITIERPESTSYNLDFYYRLLLQARDTGVGGTIDVTLVCVQFTNAESLRGLHSGTYQLTINKTRVELNPARYGFAGDGSPIEASGDDFYIAVNKGSGLLPVYVTSGTRTNVAFNLLVMTFDFYAVKIA